MNPPHRSSAAPRVRLHRAGPPRLEHRLQHLGEPGARRRRRHTLHRYSAVIATMFLGATQCDAPATPAATAATAADVVAAATADAPATTLAPTHPAAGASAAPAPAPAPVVIPGPDGTAVLGRCTQYEDLLALHAPASGWDVQRMSRLAWRESNCWPHVRSRTSDSGLLQINDITLGFLNDELGETVDRHTLTDPVQNVRAAAALCSFWARNGSSCYQPWSTS